MSTMKPTAWVAALALAAAAAPAMAQEIAQRPLSFAQSGTDWSGAYAGLSLGGDHLELSPNERDGTVVGLHGGYDVDFGAYVLGGEVEYMRSDIWSNRAADTIRMKGRAGYDMGPALVYGVLGGTVLNSQLGYNVGLGAEYMLTQGVSLGAEYVYESISDYDDTNRDLDHSSLAARLNYRF